MPVFLINCLLFKGFSPSCGCYRVISTLNVYKIVNRNKPTKLRKNYF